MAILLDLANELLLQILGSLTPIDMVSLATSCKHINTLAQHNLTLHRQRVAKYQNVTLWGCPRHQDEPHPILLLRDICNDWRIAYYARSLVIRCCGMEPPAPDPIQGYSPDTCYVAQEIKSIQSVLPKIIIPVRRMLIKALRWDEAKVNDVLDKTENGARGAILSLLMLSLPATRSITFRNFVWSDELWIDSMKTMTHLQGPHSGSPEADFLKDLSELKFYGREAPFSVGTSCSIVPFVTLPSLRVIRGYSNGWGSFKDYGFADNHGLQPSPVTELNFQTSTLEADCVIDAFLQYMQVLKRFTCDQSRGHSRIYGGEEPARIIQSLLARASGSLESLALTGFTAYGKPGPDDPQFSMKGFKVLKDIHISVDLAFIAIGDWTKSEPKTTPKHATSPLVDVLPASVKTVRLDGAIGWTDMAALLVGLPERKAECLPRLKEIFFDLDSDSACKEDSEEWSSLHQEQGIVLQLDEAVDPPFCYSGRLAF